MDYEKVPPPSLFKKLSIIGSVLRVAKNPDRYDLVTRLTDNLYAAGFFRPAVELIRKDPDGRKMLDSRFLNSGVDVKALKLLKPGTLGFEYVKFLETNGLEPVFYPAVPVVDDGSYIMMRIRQIHDILHVITGFGTSVEGEMGVQAFCLKQICYPTAFILLGGGFFRCLIDTSQSPISIVQAIAAGVEKASEYKLLIGQKLEDYWAVPLDEVRRTLRA